MAAAAAVGSSMFNVQCSMLQNPELETRNAELETQNSCSGSGSGDRMFEIVKTQSVKRETNVNITFFNLP